MSSDYTNSATTTRVKCPAVWRNAPASRAPRPATQRPAARRALAALDALTRLRMQDLLDTVQQEAGTTTLQVTHDVDEAAILADRVLILRADATGAASIAAQFNVTIPKPRDRGDPRITVLRDRLLDELGVPRRSGAGPQSPIDEEANTW